MPSTTTAPATATTVVPPDSVAPGSATGPSGQSAIVTPSTSAAPAAARTAPSSTIATQVPVSSSTTTVAPVPVAVPAPSTGTVTGTIRVRPGCGNPPVGQPCPPPQPVAVGIQAMTANGGIAASGRSASDGTYSFTLAPGSYNLFVAQSMSTQCAAQQVTISSGLTVTADFSCTGLAA